MTSLHDSSSTNNNLRLYAIDITSAIVSAFAVAPFIAIIDQAVTEKTANPAMSLYKAAFNNFKSMFLTPIKFFTKPTFGAVCIVYGATYIAANTITTFCEVNNHDSYYPKLIGTTVVNMSFGIMKDRYFAQVFNKKAPPVFPLASWGLFCIRDLFTIGAGFNFPKAASTFLQVNQIVTTPEYADKFSQVVVPMSAQLFLTPIHVLSLDIYNRIGQSFQSRFQYIKGIYPETVSIRMGRVLCAYGLAGVSNKHLKEILREKYAGEMFLAHSS